jgi:hypothetical protein
VSRHAKYVIAPERVATLTSRLDGERKFEISDAANKSPKQRRNTCTSLSLARPSGEPRQHGNSPTGPHVRGPALPIVVNTSEKASSRASRRESFHECDHPSRGSVGAFHFYW